MLKTTHLLITILSLPTLIFAHEDHEDKLNQMPLDYVPQQVINETYKVNNERIAHIRPDSRESFTDLYLKDNYIFLGNSYDGIRILDASTPSNPKEVGRFPKPNPDIATLSNGTTQSRHTGNPLILPSDLLQTPDGTIYVTDYGHTRIVGFKQTLSSAEKLGGLYKINPQTQEMTPLTTGSPLTRAHL